ncbi:MAG: 3-hydroxyacyl-ACP dehydratase FabZ [Eubacteriales bacterium]
MNIDEIKQILPHREPMLLVEEAYLNEDGSSTGYYTVKGTEYFLQGHFPGNPIVPGVILCEMTAQSACILFSGEMSGKTPVYVGINNVKFRVQVKPGDKIEFHTSILKQKAPFFWIKGEAYVGGKLAMSGEFSFAIV